MTRESRDTVRDGGDPDTRPLTIAIAGNPNCGKSALFNALTGIRQRTGNWPGVTVDRKEGLTRIDGRQFRVIDLPGGGRTIVKITMWYDTLGRRPVRRPRRQAKPLLYIHGLPGTERKACRKLCITESRHAGQQRGQQEGKRRKSPGMRNDLTDQHIDTGTEDIAQPVEHRQGQGQGAFQGRRSTVSISRR